MTTEASAVDVKKSGVDCGSFDFGTLTARNQLISKILNPALDMLVSQAKAEHVVGSETKYTLKLFMVSETEMDVN